MALSEREQRLLEEMERGLYATEADSLSTTRASSGAPSYRAIVIGVLIILAGVGALIGGVAAGYIWLGLIGFVGMLGGALFMFDPRNRVHASPEEDAKSQRARDSLAQRAERRWEERMDGDR